MAGELVEVMHGKRYKYEIFRNAKTFGGFEFVIYRDGKYWKGTYDSLNRAVQVAENAE